MPTRLIIDTDTAGDDCISLLIALLTPEISLEAITINCGNINFHQQIENALYTLHVAGYGGRVPVYAGCERPLLHQHSTVEHIHGRDGMGDSFYPRTIQRPEREHAVMALVRLINQHPGELTILAQAPLTNLAMAVRIDPSIVRKVRHVWVMGGVNNGLGNDSPAAEFNVLVDPEAARIVFGAGFPLTMVGWEVCQRHAVFTAEHLAEIAALDTPLAHFYLDVNRVVRRFMQNEWGADCTTHPDSLVAAMIADPAIMTRSTSYYVDVETSGELTRGYTLVDVLGKLKKPANTRVCLEADGERFRRLLMALLRRPA